MGEELLGLGFYVLEIVFLFFFLIKYCMSVFLLIFFVLVWMIDFFFIFFLDVVIVNEVFSKIKVRLLVLFVFVEF